LLSEPVPVSLIWAEAEGRAIGRDGELPWHLPEDLKRFRALTTGCAVVMGRVTWESLPERFRPLPDRRNIVVSRQQGYDAEGAEVVHSLDDALAVAGDGEVWVIGGASLYEQALAHADRVVRTRVHLRVEGADKFAPQLGPDWSMVERDPPQGLHRSDSGVEFCMATFRRPIT
jgi:dihydrofolate reductase